jgi:multicomponent Na+:H+ antiporter subunit D
MQAAMVISATTCIVFGVFPNATVYSLLPLPNSYLPYTADHVLAQTQLLLFSALAFTLMLLAGLYPAEIRAKNLDFDAVLNWLTRGTGRALDKGLNGLNKLGGKVFFDWIPEKVAPFLGNAPTHLTVAALGAKLRLQRLPEEEIKARQKLFYPRVVKNALPIGASAICALILLGLLAIL